MVNHELLAVHNVREDVVDRLPWNLCTIVAGIRMPIAGRFLARRDARGVAHSSRYVVRA